MSMHLCKKVCLCIDLSIWPSDGPFVCLMNGGSIWGYKVIDRKANKSETFKQQQWKITITGTGVGTGTNMLMNESSVEIHFDI